MPRLLSRVVSVSLLAEGKPVKFEQKGDRLFLRDLPSRAPDPLDTVIVVEFAEEPRFLDYFADGWAPGSSESSATS